MIQDPHIQLMLRFQGGDEHAFKELFDHYKVPLINFIYRFCQDKHRAEELSQEVFLRVYKTAATYRPEARFSTWLYRIATNICLNEIRTGRYKYERELNDYYDDGTEKHSEPEDRSTRQTGPEELEASERKAAVKHAIRQLPEKQRLALICNIYEQLPYKEIGARLGCSEAAVKSIIFRAKSAIKDMLIKHSAL